VTAKLVRVRRLIRSKEPKQLTLAQVNTYLNTASADSAVPIGEMT